MAATSQSQSFAHAPTPIGEWRVAGMQSALWKPGKERKADDRLKGCDWVGSRLCKWDKRRPPAPLAGTGARGNGVWSLGSQPPAASFYIFNGLA